VIAIGPLFFGAIVLAHGLGAHATRADKAVTREEKANSQFWDGLDNAWFFYCTAVLVAMCLFWLVRGLWRRQLDEIIVPLVLLALNAAYFTWIVATNRLGALLGPIESLL
jgi:hypothetical protein